MNTYSAVKPKGHVELRKRERAAWKPAEKVIHTELKYGSILRRRVRRRRSESETESDKATF